jgi:ferrous iron transport protein B
MMQTLATAASPAITRVAVAGNPNSGKTTIFNGLTGMRLKVGNYAGVTVERREGRLRSDPTGQTVLVDMPGTYSLAARSLDEHIARDVLLGWHPGETPPDAVIVVLDASNLERNLYLATQILELNLPVVFLCNMMDVARQRGLTISLSRLSKAFGVPVIPTIGNRAEGLEDIMPALREVLDRPCASAVACPLPPVIEQHAAELGRVLVQHGRADTRTARGAALLLLLRPSQVEHEEDVPLPVEVDVALERARASLAGAGYDDLPSYLVQARYEWLDEKLATVIRYAVLRREHLSDRIDHVLTHRIFGMVIFTLVMLGMFAAIFWLAEPAMGLVESAVGWLQDTVRASLPEGALTDLLADGVVAGVGNVVVFFPQICLLFLFVAILEDTGYMARAAFLMDRVMRRVGLHGKSFIPLLSSIACAVPGIMATRTIESRRDRLATILVAPLMVCSARLPVYFVLVALIFPRDDAWTKAGLLGALYLLGVVAALAAATILKKTILRGPTPTFIMELPPYRLPSPGPVIRVVWDRGRSFLIRAGTFILAASILLWAIFYWPRPTDMSMAQTHPAPAPAMIAGQGGTAVDSSSPTHPADSLVSRAPSSSLDPQYSALSTQHSVLSTQDSALSTGSAAASRHLEYSIAGRFGKMIEPLVRPLGYDWRIGVGIIASVAAREVFISTMGIVYSVDNADEDEGSLRTQMQAAVYPDGSLVFSRAACLSLLVFYALAMQCISTLAVTWRESGSWGWAAFQWLYMTLLAYGAAFATYRIAAAFGLTA